MKNISVDARHLGYAFGVDLHEFEPGKTYPLSKLFAALGLAKGTPKGKPRGNTK